jgi:hypothetical protein
LKNNLTSAVKLFNGPPDVMKVYTFIAPLYPKYNWKPYPAMVTFAIGDPDCVMGQMPP